MKINRIRQNVLPLVTAMIWGTAFVAQSVGAEYMGPFTFNTARAVIAFFFLLGLCGLRALWRRGRGESPAGSRRDLILGGLCCGAALSVASFFQQKGLETTTPGKAGFITALYIVLVPLAGLVLGKKVPRALWLGVALAVGGLYCLCVSEELSVTGGDLYVLACAFCFTAQILVVDHFTNKVDGVALSSFWLWPSSPPPGRWRKRRRPWSCCPSTWGRCSMWACSPAAWPTPSRFWPRRIPTRRWCPC